MNCFLCGNNSFNKREGKVRDNPSIEILECKSCGLVFLNQDLIQNDFYINGSMHNQEQIYKLTERTDKVNDNYSFHRSRFNFLINKIVGKSVLDFGSGYAGFLIQIKPYVRELAGIELEEQVEDIYKNNGIPLYRKLQDLKDKQFDMITAFHVVEHLQDPIKILLELKDYLKQNGKIIVEVPNANDALLTIYRNKAFSEFTYWSPHLFLYNPHTLRKLAEKANLKVEFIKCIQRYPLSNTLYWLSYGFPAGQKKWGDFIDNPILHNAYEQTLASLGATDTLIAQFSKI